MDIATLVETAGYLGLFIIVFAESGLFFGFFFPGDSLLFTAGLLASQGYFSITYLVILLAIAAISGDSVGYWFGKKVGPRIFTREDSFFFHKKHIERAHEFYTKYGPRALVLARFVPVVRTFVPIVAGVGEMHYPTFLRYNIIGGLLWSVGVSLLGYFLGATVPNIEEYLLPIIIVIILLSVLPVVFDLLRARRHV